MRRSEQCPSRRRGRQLLSRTGQRATVARRDRARASRLGATPARAHRDHGDHLDLLAGLLGVGFVVLGLGAWVLGGLFSLAFGPGWQEVPLSDALQLALRIVMRHADPRAAYPGRIRAWLPGAVGFYAGLASLLLLACSGIGVGLLVVRRRLGLSGLFSWAGRAHMGSPRHEPTARWATNRDLAPLVLSGPQRGRLVLGSSAGRLLGTESLHSVLVVGPTQSMKTSGLVIPALLEWEGPVVATSVKTDLVRATGAWRRSRGEVRVFDPTGVTGGVRSCWSPLTRAVTWEGARRVAAGLCGTARHGLGGLEDGGFWYATAEKLLAPLLFAAATAGATMEDVVRWVDTEEIAEVRVALELAGVPAALRAAEASFGREERQRSSIYTTAETVLAAYADPSVASSARSPEIDPGQLLDGGSHTLYLCAPAHEQERLQAVFSALLQEVFETAIERSAARGVPLDPPLLVVLDEAANLAPLRDLDRLASTVSGHGVQLMTVWQDLAQLDSRYGSRGATVVNNHRAKVLLSGVSDPATLDRVSQLVGEGEQEVASTTVDANGGRAVTTSSSVRRLAPFDWLRRLPPGEGILVYGHLPPIQLRLRPFFADRRLRAASEATPK